MVCGSATDKSKRIKSKCAHASDCPKITMSFATSDVPIPESYAFELR